jgi:hypothetical protein
MNSIDIINSTNIIKNLQINIIRVFQVHSIDMNKQKLIFLFDFIQNLHKRNLINYRLIL